MSTNRVVMWAGQPIEDLDRDQLIVVINHLANDVAHLRAEIDAMRPHMDYAGYLLAKPAAGETR